MIIEKVSSLTGVTHRREINCTPSQIKSWEDGALIQNAMPHLSEDDREFLISGSTPEEWEEMFGVEEE